MPNAAVIGREDGLDEQVATTQRQPGQFARSAQGAPWVAHPTDTTKHKGNKSELILLCAERGLEVPDKVTVNQLHDILGPRPKRVMYGRPSSLGKQIENTTNLQKWAECATGIGLYLDSFNAGSDGPWQRLCELDPVDIDSLDKEQRDVLNGVVREAKDIARAGLAADRGTHTHELTEDHDTELDIVTRIARGEELGLSVDVQRALVSAWEKALTHFGFEILAVELTCVDDIWRQAGTLDRLVRLTRDLTFTLPNAKTVTLPAGWVGILDIKTGKLRLDEGGFVAHWLSYSVQVASYAQSKPYNPDTDSRTDWPWDIAQDYAIIAHLDVLAALEGEAVCRLVLVDLEAGRHAGAMCVAAREWERRTDVFSLVSDDLAVRVSVVAEGAGSADSAVEPVSPSLGTVTAAATSDPPPEPEVDNPGNGDIVNICQGAEGELSAGLPSAPDPSSPVESQEQVVGHPDSAGEPSRRDALLERYKSLTRAQRIAYCAFKVDKNDLDAVEATLNRVTCTPEPRRSTLPAPRAPLPAEGDRVPVDSITTVKTHFMALPHEAKAWVDSLVKQGHDADVPWKPSGEATVRRFELGRAIVRLAGSDLDGFGDGVGSIVRGLLGEATGREEVEQESLPLGAAIGTLDADEATKFAQLVDRYLLDVAPA